MTVEALIGWASTHAVELDGRLVPVGRRLHQLTADEICSWVYHLLTENMDAKERRKLDTALRPIEILNDPLLPESMRGRPAPAWFDLDNPVEGSIVT